MRFLRGLLLSAVIVASVGCKRGASKPERQLVLGAYTTPREAYGKAIVPAFKRYWKDKTGEDVTFQESYQGSGTQARAIVEGFEADVAALSLDPDVALLENAKLVTKDWRTATNGGIVSRSIVVIAVRPGNPKGIHGFADLAKPGVEVLTPNVRTSGGAMWNVAAIFGAAVRGKEGGDPERLLTDILRNVIVMDKGARESLVTFEKGVGDAALTYENEVLVSKRAGRSLDYVVPPATILIENPVAVVDVYATKHGVNDLAQGFLAYLSSPDAQAVFGRYGLRPLVGEAGGLPKVDDLFTIRDLGGWPAVREKLFAKNAIYDRAFAHPVRH